MEQFRPHALIKLDHKGGWVGPAQIVAIKNTQITVKIGEVQYIIHKSRVSLAINKNPGKSV